jgi:hypothetical protein
MIYLTWFVIVGLVCLIGGFVGGIFVGAHLIRMHATHMGLMQPTHLSAQPQARTRHLPRDDHFY